MYNTDHEYSLPPVYDHGETSVNEGQATDHYEMYGSGIYTMSKNDHDL